MKKFLAILLSITIIALLIGVAAATASEKPKGAPVKVKALEEKKSEGKTEVAQEGKESEEEGGEGEEAEEEVEEIRHEAGVFKFGEHEAAWKIAAWKVIFSVLAVLFFGTAINILPKFITDRNAGGGEHH